MVDYSSLSETALFLALQPQASMAYVCKHVSTSIQRLVKSSSLTASVANAFSRSFLEHGCNELGNDLLLYLGHYPASICFYLHSILFNSTLFVLFIIFSSLFFCFLSFSSLFYSLFSALL
jgi:hypothetical protein